MLCWGEWVQEKSVYFLSSALISLNIALDQFIVGHHR